MSESDARVFTFADLAMIASAPWKNGGGATRELACDPPHAGFDDFLWRVSVAEVGRDGPFSRFPGIDRVIVALDGAGFTLCFADGRRHAMHAHFDPFAFQGEAVVEAQLAHGASVDFNLMVRRDTACGKVEVLQGLADACLPDDVVLVFVARGAAMLETGSDEPRTLQRGEFGWRPCAARSEEDRTTDANEGVVRATSPKLRLCTTETVVLLVHIKRGASGKS